MRGGRGKKREKVASPPPKFQQCFYTAVVQSCSKKPCSGFPTFPTVHRPSVNPRWNENRQQHQVCWRLWLEYMTCHSAGVTLLSREEPVTKVLERD